MRGAVSLGGVGKGSWEIGACLRGLLVVSGVRLPYLRGVVWWEYEVLVYVGVGNLGIGLSHGVDSVESFRGVWESPLDRTPGCGRPPGPVFVPEVRDPAELCRLLNC